MMRYHLKPGGLFFGEEALVNTLLGSCVAITLWFPQTGKGGMCHMMLPQRARALSLTSADLDGRYGEEAWLWLNQQARAHLLDIRDAQIKVFGGSRALLSEKNTLRDVGQKNIDFTLALLKDAGLTVQTSDLGGEGYRIIRFNLRTGDVWLKRGNALSTEMESWL